MCIITTTQSLPFDTVHYEYMIFYMHVEGRRKGAIAGVLWGGVALGVHHMSETYRPGNMLKRRLVALDLLDGSDLKGGM